MSIANRKTFSILHQSVHDLNKKISVESKVADFLKKSSENVNCVILFNITETCIFVCFFASTIDK